MAESHPVAKYEGSLVMQVEVLLLVYGAKPPPAVRLLMCSVPRGQITNATFVAPLVRAG